MAGGGVDSIPAERLLLGSKIALDFNSPPAFLQLGFDSASQDLPFSFDLGAQLPVTACGPVHRVP